MGLPRTKQTEWQQIGTFSGTGVSTGEATLGVTERTEAYRSAPITETGRTKVLDEYALELRDFTQGVWLAFECSNGSEAAGVAEVWGYAYHGDAEKICDVTVITAGTQPGFTSGTFWAKDVTADDTIQTTDTVKDAANNAKAMVKFDSGGYKRIMVLMTSKTSADASINVWARTW
jgi:hypothetical protein